MARKLRESKRSCLIISQNGDGENLQEIMAELGLEGLSSGTGREAVNALKRFSPGAIILFFHAGSEEDTLALRAAQALFKQRTSRTVVIISMEAAPTVMRLLGRMAEANNRHCLILPNPGQLKDALLRQQRPRLVAQVAPA